MLKSGSALAGLALMSLVLAGCAITPGHYLDDSKPVPTGCDPIITLGARLPFPARKPAPPVVAANVPGETPPPAPPPPGEEQRDPASDAVGAMLIDMLSQPLPAEEALIPAQPAVSESVLILSGGSQQGAFGAGFLHGWANHGQRGGTLPRFRLVTGISTGALQSTFAFLGRTDVPLQEYRISEESQLLKPLVKGKLEDNRLAAAHSLAFEGTITRLAPLRARLDKLISDRIVEDVAHEAKAGRRLLVGAVEMGTGEMAIFDLTKAAQIFAIRHGKKDFAGAEQMRQCYIEALIASSSVPIQADPVFIDNRMYIDGGARFGVLVDLTASAYDQAIAQNKDAGRGTGAPKNLFLIVNATLEVPRFCGLKGCLVDSDGQAIPPGEADPHPEWNFIQLAQRSMSVMINQAYRSSVFIADGQYKQHGFKTHFLRLDPAHLRHPAAITFGGVKQPEKTCWQWRLEDQRIANPNEFYPRYMHCLADFGLKQDAKIAEFAGAEPL
jgi:predicted acylesterase/phospholipase RssA